MVFCIMGRLVLNGIAGIFLLLSFFSCNQNKGLQEALSLSGTNRVELEEVLSHYKDSTRKLRAAEFLIENMFHYSVVDGEIKLDIRNITADYLIQNIETAFTAWEEAPWKEEVDFETFCRFVLPYRVSDEPLSDWRDTLRNEYVHLIKDKRHASEAFAKVYIALLERFTKLNDNGVPSSDVMNLHHKLQGTCSQRSVIEIVLTLIDCVIRCRKFFTFDIL